MRKATVGQVKMITSDVCTVVMGMNTLMVGAENSGFDSVGFQETKRPVFITTAIAGCTVDFNTSKDSSSWHGFAFALRSPYFDKVSVG